MSVGYCPIPGMSQPRLSMTEDEKKRWLWRYRVSLEKEKALRADLQEQETRAAKTTAALTGMPGGKSLNDKIPAAVERILALQDELLKQVDECNSCRKDVGFVIDAIEDTRLQTIFRYRYILGETWEVIAESLNLSSKWVRKLHEDYLQKLTIS